MLGARDPQALAREDFDLIVVGGGIYGIMVCLEAARRGLRPLLLERGDFGAGTSHNSLRIAHGGLRYLQTLDFQRFHESVAERRWLLRHFPDLVQPLPCLAPLYGDGLHRPSVFRAALALNDLLSWRRNKGVPRAGHLPSGRVVGTEEVKALFPGVDPSGLRGGAVWTDALVPNSPRLMIETLGWACAYGAQALNYVEATGILEADGQVAGVRAKDLASQTELTFRARAVINAAGPWAPDFARACGVEAKGLFTASLAWNVVFARPALSDCALAVKARRPGAQTYFLVPWKGALLAGTGHAAWRGGTERPHLPQRDLAAYIDNLNEAVPSLKLTQADVVRVFTGLLPARQAGSADLSVREVILDHAQDGGPSGLFSLSGVKLTTARRVADKVLARAFPAARPRPYETFERPRRDQHPDYAFSWAPRRGDNGWKTALVSAIEQESVLHLDDLLLRRSGIGDNPERALALALETCELFTWDAARKSREIAGLRHSLGLTPAATDPKT